MATAARSSIESITYGRVAHVRVAGAIDESFSPGKLPEVEQVVLDLGGVRSINSFGVGRWIDLINHPQKATRGISLIHTPPVMMDQLNLVSRFGGTAQVLSVLVPFDCPRCGKERCALVEMTTLGARSFVEKGAAPERLCPSCHEPMNFVENPAEFFGYFASLPRPTARPIVEHFLRLLRVPDGLDSTVPYKLLEGTLTYYLLRGRVTPKLNLRRLTAGLEGQVAYDFGRVSGIEAGAQDRLTALLEQSSASAEVLISRVPTVVLNVLASAEPVKLVSVVLQCQCTVCGEVRPRCVPAVELLEQCRRGPPPDRPCPVCGRPAMMLGLLNLPFLEAHADPGVPPALSALEQRATAHLLDEAAADDAGAAGSNGCQFCGEAHDGKQCPTFRPVPASRKRSSNPGLEGTQITDLTPTDLIGKVVGNYRLTRVLGEGASARVYLGEHTVIGSRVAVKVLHKHLTRDASIVARFIREARTTGMAIHDNVVQVIDINTHDHNVLCIIMEYLDGQTMGESYDRKVVPYDEAAPLLLQACDALATAHARGIVHRDLKPDNIYLLKRPGRTQIKIVDFGIAFRESLADGESRTRIGTILGTPQYMSPEQSASGTIDNRSDIYSLGVIMFELATGRPPFEHSNLRALLSAHCIETPPRPRSINPAIDPAYEEVILRTLAKDPKDRYQTMADLGRAIALVRLEAAPAPPEATGPVAELRPLPLETLAWVETPPSAPRGKKTPTVKKQPMLADPIDARGSASRDRGGGKTPAQAVPAAPGPAAARLEGKSSTLKAHSEEQTPAVAGARGEKKATRETRTQAEAAAPQARAGKKTTRETRASAGKKTTLKKLPAAHDIEALQDPAAVAAYQACLAPPPEGPRESSVVPAARRAPRHKVDLPVEVELVAAGEPGSGLIERMTIADISLSGALVRSEKTVAEVFTRVLLNPLMVGAHPVLAEVTRTMRNKDPQTNVVISGFGVRFIPGADPAAQERTIGAILALGQGSASGQPIFEAEVEQFLGRIEAAADGDHYAVLGVPLHANFPTARNACIQLARVLESPQLKGLLPKDEERMTRLRDRLSAAEDMLLNPARRAGYDATRGNFVGIARCLASGLETYTLLRLREQFLTKRPEVVQLIKTMRRRLDEIRTAGDPAFFLEGLTIALRADPLNIDLHTQYWGVRRRLKAEEPARE